MVELNFSATIAGELHITDQLRYTLYSGIQRISSQGLVIGLIYVV